MARETIKDAAGKLLGSIERNSSGAERAYDSNGQIVGSYDRGNNITKSPTGELLAKGNALSGLIFSRRR